MNPQSRHSDFRNHDYAEPSWLKRRTMFAWIVPMFVIDLALAVLVWWKLFR